MTDEEVTFTLSWSWIKESLHPLFRPAEKRNQGRWHTVQAQLHHDEDAWALTVKILSKQDPNSQICSNISSNSSYVNSYYFQLVYVCLSARLWENNWMEQNLVKGWEMIQVWMDQGPIQDFFFISCIIVRSGAFWTFSKISQRSTPGPWWKKSGVFMGLILMRVWGFSLMRTRVA